MTDIVRIKRNEGKSNAKEKEETFLLCTNNVELLFSTVMMCRFWSSPYGRTGLLY